MAPVFLVFYLIEDLAGFRCQRRDLLDAAFLAAPCWRYGALPFVDHIEGQPEQIALAEACLSGEDPQATHPWLEDRQNFLLFVFRDLPAGSLGSDYQPLETGTDGLVIFAQRGSQHAPQQAQFVRYRPAGEREGGSARCRHGHWPGA
jgi:hypothetical protein